MSKVNMTIWGRPFNIEILFECYGEENVTRFQEKSLGTFLKNNDINKSLDKVKGYCLEDENLRDVSSISNIFIYVIPQALYVKRDPAKSIIFLLCDFKYDNEHGIAIVFEKGKYKTVISQAEL